MTRFASSKVAYHPLDRVQVGARHLSGIDIPTSSAALTVSSV
jgi:hypothetical protein